MTQEGSEAFSVDSVHEEYQHIAEQRCECGGVYRVEQQMLLHEIPSERRLDSLRCKCVKCGRERGFCFDITDLFRRQRQSWSDQNTTPEGEA